MKGIRTNGAWQHIDVDSQSRANSCHSAAYNIEVTGFTPDKALSGRSSCSKAAQDKSFYYNV